MLNPDAENDDPAVDKCVDTQRGTPSTRNLHCDNELFLPVLHTKTNTFLGTQLEAELRAAPVPPLRVPADLVARAHADPLGDGPVLGHLLRERPLRAERLVRRLRGGARRVSGLRGAWRALGTRVCSVPPIRGGGGETRF